MSLTLLLTHSTSEDSSKHKQIVAYQRQLGKKLDMIKQTRSSLIFELFFYTHWQAFLFLFVILSKSNFFSKQTIEDQYYIPLILKKTTTYLPKYLYVLHSYTSLKKGTNYYVHIPNNFQILRLKWSFNNINQLCIIIFYFK